MALFYFIFSGYEFEVEWMKDFGVEAALEGGEWKSNSILRSDDKRNYCSMKEKSNPIHFTGHSLRDEGKRI